MAEKFYITTAIDYPSGNPHMGHCYEKVCTDVIARWKRLELGKENVFFQTGMDEHGLKIQRIANKEGLKPQEYVDSMVKIFKDFCKTYNISYDQFIRTTDEKHVKFCQNILQKVYDKGDIYKSTYKGLYCVDCETYYSESELDNGLCPYHHKPCEVMEEDAYFFKMSEYKDKVKDYIEKERYILPKKLREFLLGRLEKEDIKDLCISRSNFAWGVPMPFDKKHYTYVWFDALLNYVSGVSGKKLERFWPADLHVIGYDILWHHSIIWLSILMSAELPLPKKLFAHGFVNAADGQKMSKSLGNVVDPMKLAEQYPIDSIRYYLIRETPFGSDLNFSKRSLVLRHNNELVNDLGNLLNRTTVMINKFFDNIIPDKGNDEITDKLNFEKIKEHINNYELSFALAEIWRFIAYCNKYINDNKPWELAKNDKKRLAEVMYNLAEGLRFIALLIKPFMPKTSERIAEGLAIENFEDQTFEDLKFGLIGKNKIPKAQHLFTKIEIEEPTEVKKMEENSNQPEYQTIEDWKKFDLRVGKVIKIEPHPNADNLYVLLLDMGEHEPDRQIVAGLRKYYTPEELMGKEVIVIANLKPAVLRGIESNGMLLAAEDNGKVKMLVPEEEVTPGSKIY